MDTANGLPSFVDVGSKSHAILQFMERLAKAADKTKRG